MRRSGSQPKPRCAESLARPVRERTRRGALCHPKVGPPEGTNTVILDVLLAWRLRAGCRCHSSFSGRTAIGSVKTRAGAVFHPPAPEQRNIENCSVCAFREPDLGLAKCSPPRVLSGRPRQTLRTPRFGLTSTPRHEKSVENYSIRDFPAAARL